MIPGTWLSFPAPKGKTLNVIKDSTTFSEGIVMRTLSGLVTRASTDNATTTPLWITVDKPQDAVWLAQFTKRLGLTQNEVDDLWSTVGIYKDAGFVKGFVVYNEDTSGTGTTDGSVNIATSLAAPLGAIAVSADLVDAATGAGLTQLADARTMTFADLQSQYGDKLSKSTLGLLRTDMPRCRDMVVAQGAAVGIDVDGQGYTDLLQILDPGATVIGYGTSEDGSVHSASTVGAGLVASDWFSNWNVLSLGAEDASVSALPSLAGNQGAVTDDSTLR